MLEISYSKFIFKKKEVWLFNGENIIEKAYTTYPYYNTYPGGKIIEEYSCFIDLTQSLEKIKSQFSKTTRLHINKANKLNTHAVIDFSPNNQSVLNFSLLFEKFALEKKISFSKQRIIQLQKTNNLILSYAYLKNKVISMHAYLHDNKSVILLHTFNTELNNSLSSVCNKYLHWQEIISFKENNFEIYDFGGIDLKKVPGISRFKLSFGAEIIKRNNAIKTNLFFKLLNLFRL